MFVSKDFILKEEKDTSFDSDYEEINKEISKALIEMDTEKDETEENSFQFHFNHHESTSFDSDLSQLSCKSASGEPDLNERWSFSSIKSKTQIAAPSFQFTPYFSDTFLNGNTSHDGFNLYYSRKATSNPYAYCQPGSHLAHNQFSFNAKPYLNSFNSFESKQAPQQRSNNAFTRPKKTKKQLEAAKNKISLEKILSLKDKRTTLMIKNIPNRFSLKQFIDEIRFRFHNKYDVIYLPTDAENKCNLGFGFINFLDPMTIVSFYDCYYGQKWARFNSEKRCELAFAKVQGREQLIKYIERAALTQVETSFIQEAGPRTNIEVPLKYLQTFLSFHPYAVYRVAGFDKFIVESYFNC